MAQIKHGKLTISTKKILKELVDNPTGLRAVTIAKLTNLPPRTVYNGLNKLKQQKLIQNIYPIWQLCHFQGTPLKVAHLLKSDKIQLHDFSYVIKLIKTPDWWKYRSNKFIKLNLRQLRWGNNPYHQQKKDDFLIQIFSSSMIFINQKKYWGKDTYDCFIQASRDFLNAYYYIEELFNFKFFPDGVPNTQVRSQHYVKLNDLIANKCKKNKNKFRVDIDGKHRMWVDMSRPFGMEAGHKDYAPEDLERYEKQVQNIIKYDPPTLTDMMDMFKEMATINKETASGLNVVTQIIKSQFTKQIKPKIDEELQAKNNITDDRPSYVG